MIDFKPICSVHKGVEVQTICIIMLNILTIWIYITPNEFTLKVNEFPDDGLYMWLIIWKTSLITGICLGKNKNRYGETQGIYSAT